MGNWGNSKILEEIPPLLDRGTYWTDGTDADGAFALGGLAPAGEENAAGRLLGLEKPCFP